MVYTLKMNDDEIERLLKELAETSQDFRVEKDIVQKLWDFLAYENAKQLTSDNSEMKNRVYIVIEK